MAFRAAGVIGWPVAHSRSPQLHGYWLRKHGIDGAYIPMPVQPGRVDMALRGLAALGFAGCNVTLPHKEAALRAVDRAEPLAQRVGAANLIVVEADGLLTGRSTDGFGFIENLRGACAHEAGAAWRGEAGPAVVLGAGGGARAIVFALLDAGVPELRLLNRTRDRAEELAASIGGASDGNLRVLDWTERAAALDGAALLVNTTTLGMTGHPPLDLALNALPRTALVCDIVYVPLTTPLLAAARARGNAVANGLGMLLHQARPSFEAWFGVMPDVTPELRELVERTLS